MKKILLIFLSSAVVGLLMGLVIRSWFKSAQAMGPDLVSQSESSQVEPERTPPSVGSTSSRATTKALANVPRAQRYLWLAAQVENASPSEMRRLFRLAGVEGHTDLQRAIAERWAALDPTHMFNSLCEEPGFSHRIVRILFENWAKSDPDHALAQVMANKKHKDYRHWGISLSNELMKHAPAKGFSAYNQLGVRGYLPDTKRIGEWAKKDPKAAAELVVGEMKRGTGRVVGQETLRTIAKVWGESDPEAALSFGQKVDDRNYRYVVLVNAMTAWAQSAPEAAADYAASQSDGALRTQLGNGLVAGLAKSNPEAALNWAHENLESSARASAISDAVSAIAEKDIDAAAAMIVDLEPGSTMNYAVSQVVEEWSRHGVNDNTAMWDWIASLDDVEARDRAVQRLEGRLHRDSRNGLVDLVSGKHGHLATEAMVERAARQKARQDPESAAAWARTLPEDRSATALDAVINLWRSSSPGEADAWETAEGK